MLFLCLMVVTNQLIFCELFAQLSPRSTTFIMDDIFSIEIDKQVQNAIVLTTTILITHHLHNSKGISISTVLPPSHKNIVLHVVLPLHLSFASPNEA